MDISNYALTSSLSVWRDDDWNGTAALRGSGTTDRVATDRVIVAFGLAGSNFTGTSAAISRCGVTAIGTALRGSGTTDRVATDRVIVALTLVRDNSNGTSAAISRCGVTAIGTAL